MNFRFPAKFFMLCLAGTFAVSFAGTVDKPYEVGVWGDFAQGAVSITFDDNKNTSPSAPEQKAFDDKKIHMTCFVQTGSCNWNDCKATFAKGHEIASHSVSHPQTMPTSELGTSQKSIQQNVPGEKCVSIAYPNCNTPGDQQVLQYYLGGRNCNGSGNPKTPGNWAQIGSKGFGSGSGGYPNDANSMNTYATSSGWAVELHHGIGSQSHSWATTDLNAMKTHLDYLDKNRSKVWAETFGNVARYIKERDAASVKAKDSTDKSFTVTVTDNLADSIFNYPLSIRRPLPANWKPEEVSVTQGGKAINDTIVANNIMFYAVPDGGDVVINGGIVRVNGTFPRSGFGGTSPAILQRSALLIDSRQFNSSELAVTLFDLSGKVLARYTLGANESRIALPADKINRSAFIVKITGGSKTWSGKFMPQM